MTIKVEVRSFFLFSFDIIKELKLLLAFHFYEMFFL